MNFTVIDNTPPTIDECAADQTISAGSGCFVALPDLTDDVIVVENCSRFSPATTSQSPIPGTMLPMGVTVVTFTFTFTFTDGAGNSSTCTANITVTGGGLQVATYVDDDYTGLPNGTTVTWPHIGGSGSYTIGCEAFATIQGGVNGVAASGTVNVASGLYAEDVNINKANVQVYGAGSGVTTIEGVLGA